MADNAKSEPTTLAGWRKGVDRGLLASMECLVLALVFLSPWAFGAVDPRWEFWLYLGIALLLVLWALRILLQGRFSWTHCSVAYCLAGFVLLALWQLTPLPAGVLAAVSPGTAQLYDRLLPAELEQWSGSVPAAHPPAGTTISVYPYGTRRELVHLLAVLFLYLVVRNNLAAPACVWRLSWAGLITGTALAIFSLVQFFTSRPNLIYWSTPAEGGSAFGPFVSRNDFPFYLNLCFGLGLGLLCSQLSRLDAPKHGAAGPSRKSGVFDLLHQPQVLWIGFFLMLMATSIVFSVSRGGLLAFLGAGMFCLTLIFKRSARFVHLETGLLIVVGSLALLTWFGLERVQTRLGTLFQDQVFKDGRVSLLSRAPPLVQQFPLWGAGFGSLDFVEPMHRTDATDAGWSYQHAHNEYLESLIEGGLVGLVLTVLVVGLVLRLGLRAFRRLEGIPTQGLVLGLLFGFATLALHSIVDFGIHVPAIALLATVICAHLSALSNGEPAPARVGPGPESVSTPWSTLLTRWLVALLGIVALVCVALFLLAEGYRGASVSRLLDGALALKGAVELPDQKARLAVLEEASDLDPANPRLHFEVGEKHAAVYDALKQKQLDQEALLDGIQALALLNPGCAPAQGSNGGLGLLFVAKVHQERRKRVMLDLERRHLAPALHHLLQARDLCPTRAKPHLEIAAYAELMKKADSRRTYIDRALFLDPTNPDFWYRAGILEARDLHPDQAARDWRRSLELSDVFLKKILARTARLSSQDLMDHVLPEDPYIHIASALHLFPTPDDPRRLPFFNKARRLYETLPGPWRAEDLHQKAFVLASLNHPKEAAATYREALAQKPLVLEWRLDLARLLYQQEKFLEAQQELRTILAVQPRNGEAQDLLRRTEREIGKNRGR